MGLFEDIINFFRNFYSSYIAPAIAPIKSAVDSAYNFLSNQILPKLSEVYNRVISLAQQVYNLIAPKITEVVQQVQARLEPLKTFVSYGLSEVKSFISSQVYSRIVETINRINEFRNTTIGKLWEYSIPIYGAFRLAQDIATNRLPRLPPEIQQRLQPFLNQASSAAINTYNFVTNYLFPKTLEKLEEIPQKMKTQLDGAFAGLADLVSWFKSLDFKKLLDSYLSQIARSAGELSSLVARVAAARSLVSPEDAVLKEKEFMPKAAETIWATNALGTAIEAFTIGQMDINLANLLYTPDMEVVRSTYIAVQKMKVEMGFLKPLQYFYNRYYLPNIPPPSDLITMVVREAFVPERVTPAPELFVKYMQMHGFAKEWADRYWTAHWVLIPLERATEMYWRGIMTEDYYKKYLILHDYRPDEIDYILKWVWRPPNRTEARMMYDLGVLKEEDLDYIARASGIEERFREGWKMMIRGFRVRPLLTKIETIATDAYENGYIGIGEYQKLLKEAGFSDVVIQWILKIGQLQRRFKLMKMTVDTIVLKYRKGFIDKNTALQQLTSLGLDTDTALHHLNKAEVQALRASDKAKEKAPKLTVAQLVAAWKTGVIETEDLVDALAAKGYTEQEIRILIETELAKMKAA